MPDSCARLDQSDVEAPPSADGCADDLRVGAAGRICGCAGCAITSGAAIPRPRSTPAPHLAAAEHALMSSYEPGEDWSWCFEDELSFVVPDLPTSSNP
jgi:hypothetical protein